MSDAPASNDPYSPKPRPRWLSRVIAWPLITVSILGFYGLVANRLLPSNLGLDVGYAAAVVGAAVGLIVSLLPPAYPIPARADWVKNPRLRIPFMMVLFALLYYMGAQFGFLSLYTWAMGKPGEETVTISYWRNGDAKLCDGPQLVGEQFLSHVICINPSWRDKAPAGTQLVVGGNVSPFGIYVTTVRRAQQ